MTDPTLLALNLMWHDGYRCGLTIDAESGIIQRCSLERTASTLPRWIQTPATLAAQWTVEAGCAPDFLADPMLAAYLTVDAKLAVFCQRKIDAIKIAAGVRLRLFKH